ncbi:MAG: fumarylacetoacetate hydrolase family protein [Rhodobacter sp.]|uniref:fumarylacetoacetate hydrolase family protein n=1 Tax=Pararhodobacter sp. TaxID=2127056 RepID=UPI001DC0E9D1|nr:fumarylacetoacetate hydrolase family protein [Pararhodobacter sp.]MCB1344644.1 fumarylacetoacetate hydrolase family protein [Paracoccaceae bacterium]MCC0071873.1 fumarylacetoacetate hydrolase family protein [Rhodobacter sp.]HPD92600.1 fumarylacetoacetate hydrolase family protein [Pararhodobacter sp.]
MSGFLFPVPPVPTIALRGESAAYAVSRIFCVGRNYAAHAAEMGVEVDREAPFYFTKSPAHLVPSGVTLPYPPGTDDYHHEMELAFALGAPLFRASRQQASAAILAYGCALDMTRRDLQGQAKNLRRPWDLGKDFEGAAVLAEMTRAADFGPVGAQRIHLSVNGQIRQQSDLSLMIHDCVDVLVHLSKFYHLGPGDVILTGTPEGVGAVHPGDVLEGGIDGLAPVRLTIGAAD